VAANYTRYETLAREPLRDGAPGEIACTDDKTDWAHRRFWLHFETILGTVLKSNQKW